MSHRQDGGIESARETVWFRLVEEWAVDSGNWCQCRFVLLRAANLCIRRRKIVRGDCSKMGARDRLRRDDVDLREVDHPPAYSEASTIQLSLVLPAYNERERIETGLESTLGLDRTR